MKKTKNRLFILLFFLILILGLGLRLYMVYALPYHIDCDNATIGLMAKHILEGNIPLFFYGQEYLGPLEAFVMAGAFKIFGISMYSMFYGQVLFSFLFLLSTYFLARELSNRWGGLIAMLYCALAPYYLVDHNILPYGYHVELLLFGNLLFFLTYKIIEAETFLKKKAYYIIFGFIAGLAFWTQYLVVYYLTAIAFFLIINEKWGNLFKYGFLSAIFFFLGGLPFWVYTIIHRLGSFGFPSSSKEGFLPAINKFFSKDCMKLLGLREPLFTQSHLIDIIIALIYIYICLYFIISTFLNKHEAGYRISKNYLFLFLSLSLVVFYASFNFFSVRGPAYYILPVFSIIPVMFAYLFRSLKRIPIALSLVLFIPIMAFNVKDIYTGIRGDKAELKLRAQYWSGYINFLKNKGITRVLGGDASDFVTCFLTKERIIASPYGGSEYKPYSEMVEYADEVALIDIGPGFKSNIDMLCKDYKFYFRTYYNLTPYEYNIKSISPENWKAYSDYYSNEANRAFNKNCDLWWSTKTPKKNGMNYMVDLGKKYKICRFLVFNADHYYNLPVSCRVSVSLDGKKWNETIYIKAPEPLFWSGPRLYWHLVYGRWEVVFKPVEARYIRLTNIGEDYRNPMEINEIYIYEFLGYRERMGKNKDYVRYAKRIFEFAKTRNINFIYADFWVSSKIKKWGVGKIKVLDPFYVNFPKEGILDRMVSLTPDTMFVISRENQEEFDSVVNEFKLSVDKKTFGDFVCYFITNWNGTYLDALQDEKWLYWTGIGVIKKDIKYYSRLLAKYAVLLEEKGDYKNAELYYKEAIKYYPNNNTAHMRLVILYKKLGLVDEFKKQLKLYRYKFVPHKRNIVGFKNRASFVGYSINKNRFKPGEQFRLDLFWRLKKDIPLSVITFIHFSKDGRPLFQNDHPFLYKFLRPIKPLDNEIFKDTSIITIPLDIEPGDYDIVIGLWLPKSGERIPLEGKKRESKIKLGEIQIYEI